MKKLFILMACVFLSVRGYAQAPDVLPQVFSPNAAELGKYGKVPVNYFNGLPNITIPLTELKAKGYTLPVYLTYHAGGNKPDQHPGWVGQGWALHAGGCINRIIRGQKDEMTKSEYYMRKERGEYPINYDPPYNIGYLYRAREFQSLDWRNGVSTFAPGLSPDAPYDYEPDEFQISVDGVSASFFLTGDGSVKIVSKSDVDFTVSFSMNTTATCLDGGEVRVLDYKFSAQYVRVYDTFSEFVITAKDGTRYYFGGNEDAIEYSICNYTIPGEGQDEQDWDLLATANTWMLTKILRPNGEEVLFNYTRRGIPIVEVDSHYYEKSWFNAGPPRYGFNRFDPNRNISFYFLLPSYLKSISCKVSNDYLSLNTVESVQMDYDYDKKLFNNRVGDIGLYEYLQPMNHYEQLESIDSPRGRVLLSYTNDSNIRLRLDTVKIVAGQNDTLKYVMGYNNTPLPRYYSRKTDAWGYYNYDRVHLPAADEINHVHYVANPTLLQAEMLMEIKYPTGGRTCFEYEPHDYSHIVGQFPFALKDSIGNSGGLRVRKITDYSANGQGEDRFFSYKNTLGLSSGILSGIPKYVVRQGVNFSIVNPEDASYSWLDNPEEGQAHDFDNTLRYVYFSEHMLNQLSGTDGNHITYSMVTETISGGGRVEYTYSNHDTRDMQCLDRAPIAVNEKGCSEILNNAFSSMSLNRGLLLRKTILNENDIPVKEERFVYAQDTTECVYSLSYFLLPSYPTEVYRVSLIKHYSFYPFLSQKIEKSYSDYGDYSMVDTTFYDYNKHRQLTRTVRQNEYYSEETRIIYAGDSTLVGHEGVYAQMKAAGILDRPVEQTVLRNGKVVSSSLITYRKSGNQFVPDKYYEARLDAPILEEDWRRYDGYFTDWHQGVYGAPKLTFDSYDAHGNILAATSEGGLRSLYSWDPNGLNPEASFTGMLTPVRNVQVEASASQDVNFNKELTTEYTFEFTASRSGDISFYMNWPDGRAYDMSGEMDGNAVFSYSAKTSMLSPITEVYCGTVSAGRHTLRIVRTGEVQSGPDWIEFSPYLRGSGWISYPVYRTEQRADEIGAWFYDFETDGNRDKGFDGSQKAWLGSRTFTRTIPSGVPYTIDWMERGSGGLWTYHSQAFTGSAVVGSNAAAIDNVRIYPSDAAVNSWTWTDAGELSSATDGRGITEYYGYDGLGRLVTVKDADKKTKVAYGYHYASSSAPENYVRTSVYTNEAGTTARETIQYHDGLGRPWQTLSLNAGKDDENNMRHLAERTDYDAAGRPFRTWLPFRTASLSPQTNLPSESIYSDVEPFSLVEYDESPLERPRLEYGPGVSWHTNGKAVSHGYYTNGGNALLNCTSFTISWRGDTTAIISNNRLVPSETLSVESVTDEDGLTLLTFKDMYGQTLLERRHPVSGENLDTYYLYDELGRLSAVLPPAISQNLLISNSDIDKYAYLYRYDARGNCIAKKLPGCGWSFMVYDARGAMIMSQDAVQRRNGEWTLAVTDGQGRQCLTGTCTATLDVFDNPYGNASVYARKTGSSSGMQHLGEYHGYTIYTMSPRNFSINQATLWSPYGPAESYDRVLGPVSGGKMLKTMYTYDARGRVIKTERQTHLDGMETEQLTYSFTDEVLSRALIHTNTAGQSQLEQYTYTYDHWGRPLQTKHRMGVGSEVTLHDNVYDGVGRLASDGRSVGTYALHTTYSNNVRSWLTDISCTGTGGSLFQEALYYESPVSEGTPRWAGNISQLAWRSGSESTMKRYSFSYDGFGRLLSAAYNGDAMGGNYSTSYAYDANSNLTSIARAAVTGLSGGLVLPRTGTSYLLDGNQVQARLQGGGLRLNGGLRPSLELRQVYYDACGRMVCDSDRGINKVEYNALYLPSTIEYATDGNSLTGYSYGVQYAADGRKLRTGRLAQAKKRLQNATVTDYPEEEELPSAELESLTPGGGRIPVLHFESPTDYVGNLVYKDGVLEKILIDGGFITASDGRYHFFVTDHLGNVRVVVNDAGVIEQVNQFYPYGESIELDPVSANPGLETITENPYKWGGKEWDEEQGAYDFGARMYSASDARWTTMDPLCEKYYSISPYAYCAGNPVNLVDPDGQEWDVVNGVITLYLNYTNSAGLSEDVIKQYQDAIIALFNNTISSASSGAYSGNVVFCDSNPDIVQTVDFGRFLDNNQGGCTSYMNTFINANDKEGKLCSPESIAQTTVHELFHTVRLHHIFDYTQSADTELISLGANCFSTTENTNPNIVNNIMNYNYISINGEKGTNLVFLTPGQLDLVLKEIQLQKQGYGFIGRGKSFKEYEKYWNDELWPGVPVRQSH